MKNIIVIIWQLITYFLIGIPLRIIFKVKCNYQFKYEKGKKYIIAANHPAKTDPFLISYSVPFTDFIKLIPFRFITAEEYMIKPLFRPFLLLYGCITTKKISKGTVLERSIKLLNKGETIFIFPSGKLERQHKKYDPKIGVAHLEKHVHNAKIIPVKIEYKNKPTSRVKIEFKKSAQIKNNSQDLQKSANEIYNQILAPEMIDTSKLYRLPWTMNDNPNGWIEPTTYCQLKCPGCYRGLAEDNPKRKHETLASLKKEVDWFEKNRNVQTISIAGGEPLCYPDLDQLVQYISDKKLKTKIYTNGLALTPDKIKSLKKVGVTEIIVHIDKFQRNSDSEESMNKIRHKYCEMFRKEGKVNLGFIMPLSRQNISDLPIISNFFQKNSDIINLIVFTVYKEMLPNKKTESKNEISMQEVASSVQDSFGLDYCANLGKKNSSNVSWLFSLSAYAKGTLLGSFDKHFYKTIQDRYYSKRKKNFITIKNQPISSNKLFSWSLNKSARAISYQLIKKRIKKVNTQVVLLIDAPDNKDGKWDLCDGCPDAMLHNGNLVPSCLLERIKNGEKIHTY